MVGFCFNIFAKFSSTGQKLHFHAEDMWEFYGAEETRLEFRT
jgi:hypothetical protein